MRQDNYRVLSEFSQALQTELPEVQWDHHRIGVLYGEFDHCYRFRLCLRNRFAYLFCGGLIVQNLRPLSEINLLLLAPLRVAKRRISGPAYIVASWPIELSMKEQANTLVTDLRRLIFGPLQLPNTQPINTNVKNKLRDIAACEDYFQGVPASDDAFEFIIGKGKNSLQIRACQPRGDVLSLTTLVTNYTASEQSAQALTAETIFGLNSQLRWSRLVCRGEVIEAEVTIPVSALLTRVWQLAKHSLYQIVSHRDVLRVVQQPLVAQEAEHILVTENPPKTFQKRRCTYVC